MRVDNYQCGTEPLLYKKTLFLKGFVGTDKYGCVRKHTESAAPQRGCEVAKLALCGEDVKEISYPFDWSFFKILFGDFIRVLMKEIGFL